MTWHEWRDRGVALAGRIRARVRPRHVVRATGAAVVLGGVLVGAEALLRARLGPIESRLPSAFQTRPVSWDEDDTEPVVLGPVPGAPDEWREPLPLADFPDHLVEAVLAVEDQRFLEHGGLDLRRIGGAFAANLRAGEITQGGSTITQQLAKNLFLHARRTPGRKIREAAMALVLESRHDKPAILEAYLNEVYLGQSGGSAIHGMGAAARHHLGKSAERLTVAESALLAAMIRSPNRLAPSRHPEDARARRDLVLHLMAEQGRISEAQAERAARVAVPRRVHGRRTMDGRHFRDLVAGMREARVPARGHVVHVTLDAGLQRAAERAVARTGRNGAEVALVALDPRSGEVLAMVGGRDYGRSQFNRATEARRQPGSAFKPIVALAALAREGRAPPTYTLASVLPDEPFRVQTASGPWAPVNYDRTWQGDVTLREAMERSLNVPFARLGVAIGPERIAATARALGIASPLTPVPALALGSGEVTLLELVRAYGVLAAGGELAPTRTIIGRRAAGATAVATPSVRRERVVDPATAYLVTSMLEGVVDRGTARALPMRGAIAGKTGTTNDWRDAWFVAYTPTLAVGVWVGHDDGRSLGQSGATAALPVVARFLQEGAPRAARGAFEVPDGIVTAHLTSGDGWFRSCGREEFFLEGTAPDTRGCLDVQLSDWVDDLVNDRLAERFSRALERDGERELRRLEAMLEREAARLLRRLERRGDN